MSNLSAGKAARTARWTVVIAGAAILGIGGVLIGVNGFGTNSPAAAGPTTEGTIAAWVKTNDGGQTFGVLDDVNNPPDLILVVTNEGPEAYVYATDFFGDRPSNPEEAIKLAAEPLEEIVLTAYAEDGKTRVGTFTQNTGVEVTEIP